MKIMDQAKLDKLVANREKAMAGGGEAAVEKHHAKGTISDEKSKPDCA